MIRFYLILLLSIIEVTCRSCPHGYVALDSEKTCIHWSSRRIKLDRMEGYCQNEGNGGIPFTRRLSDKGLEDLEELLLISLKSTFNSKVFIGIRRKRDQMNQGTKTFVFSDGEEIAEGDYTLWYDDPSLYDCGVVDYSEDFKVVPFSCDDSAAYMCEKNEPPCRDDVQAFVEYHQHCLAIMPRKDSFATAEYICQQTKAHLFAYKDRSHSPSVAGAIYNFNLQGGIYAGLQKKPDGSWEYGDGEVEKSRWIPENEGHEDCGILAFLQNLTLGLFSMDCKELTVLCEFRGTYTFQLSTLA